MTARFSRFATLAGRTSALGLALVVAACGSGGSSDAAAGAPAAMGGSSAGATTGGSGAGAGVAGGSSGATTGGAATGGSSTGGMETGGSSGASVGGGGVGGATGGTSTGGVGGMAGSAGTGGAATAPAFDADAVKAVMRKVADYEIARFANGNDNGWVRAAFHPGMLAAYRALGDAKYHDYTLNWGTVNNWKLKDDGSDPATCLSATRTTCGPRFADNQACVQAYAELYLESPTAQNAVMLTAAQTTFDAMVAAPRTGRVEWWWEDALFMAPPALARVAAAVPAKSEQYLTLMDTMFWDTKAFLFDPATGLFWRDSSFLNTNTYWSRGNGWVVAGTARILDVLPAADARRAKYEALLKTMATKLASVQAADGYWRSSLTQPNAYTDPETSGTAFFTFGIAWGINHGVLDRATFLPIVMKSWPALVKAVNAQGRLGYVQAVGAAPGPSTVDNTNDYATGAFLLSGEQLLKL